ncbi:CBS domain-containing protein [Nitrincola sp. MINF-07-Sa-05]|uniref:CBS domain-containing protein n=1 Tax=Nitrincola salilacus TaxID=3400273 RepID=UPI003917C636
MALAIYDHGYRIQTPVRSLFQDRSVESLTETRRSRHIPGSEEHLAEDVDNFFHIDPDARKKQPAVSKDAGKAYEETLQAGKPKPIPILSASKIMTSPVQTITPENNLRQAWLIMEEHEISQLVVVTDENKPLGLITRQEIIDHGTDSTVTIAVTFQKRMIVAAPETELPQIATIFVDYPVTAIPVIDQGDKLQGIITRTDLIRLLINSAHIESWA